MTLVELLAIMGDTKEAVLEYCRANGIRSNLEESKGDSGSCLLGRAVKHASKGELRLWGHENIGHDRYACASAGYLSPGVASIAYDFDAGLLPAEFYIPNSEIDPTPAE